MTSWALMPSMSFLIPHIGHRKTRGSMTFSQLSKSSTPSSGLSSNSQDCISSPSLSPLDSVYEETLTQHDTESNTYSSLSFTSDDVDNAQVPMNTTINEDEEKQLDENGKRNAEVFPSKRCKTAVPPPNAFCQQKKNKETNLELMIAKSSSAIQSMAACFTQDTTNETDKEKKMHPFVVAMEAAFKKVPSEMEMECFIAVLNIINEYQQ
ncbi:PREDICTED: uncharacterized protein LOC105556555 [Vollenhovia emeryi]|uniref:uncharacterized protein LOC105556555 n=1 Tax=Vollenhovia emeryi TaxID=411798 RepID=UPI0005F42B66|nr:PREDICTED: uncharacterized protein LOC105556555 [Vollenhovia emeryi]